MIDLSYSACQRYLTSPKAWFLYYKLKLRPVMQSSALVFGSALDVGLNSLLLDKKNGKVPSLILAKAEFDREFKKVPRDLIKISKSDGSYEELWDKGYILLEEYLVQAIPKIDKVIEVQLEVKVKNDLGDSLVAKADVIVEIAGKRYLTDNKSTSIKYSDNSANESAQLASYYELLRDQYKLDGVLFITIPKKLRSRKLPIVDIDFIFGTSSEELIEKTFQQYDNALNGIKNAEFPCTREMNGGCCSQFWGKCDYLAFCTSEGKNMIGLKVKE